MSYQTYITEAIVLGSYDANTADRSYLLFTERSGTLYASARSVREERSRQRYALQDFSRIAVTLIKGKGGWRIGSVEVLGNYFMSAPSRAARGSVVKLVKCIRRYVHGEVADPALYDELVAALVFLSAADCPLRDQWELVALVRLLHQLGYIDATKTLQPLLQSSWDMLEPEQVLGAASELALAYRGAQAASHLAT